MSSEAEEAAVAEGKGKVRAVLKKRQFLETVATASGQKKPAVKSVVDATLAELGAALSRGESLLLPPLGRITLTRSRDVSGSEIMVLKLRRSRDDTGPAPEADVDEDGAED